MTTKKKARPPLVPLGDLLVLGGRYRFGRGQSWNKQPLMYMSIPHKPGLSVMADNLWAFHKKLGEMIESGFPELRGEPVPKELQPDVAGVVEKSKTPEVEKKKKKPVEPVCPGPSNADWRYINKVEGGLKAAPELFVTHPLKATKDSTVCPFCTFDSAKVNMYEDLARELRLSEEGTGGEPATPTGERTPKRTAAFP